VIFYCCQGASAMLILEKWLLRHPNIQPKIASLPSLKKNQYYVMSEKIYFISM
jgi:hypothetical protein